MTTPQTVFLVQFALGCVLGAIVARRRRGTVGQRGRALVEFLLNSLIVALDSSTLSTVVQTKDDPLETWAGLGSTISLLALILSTPALAVVVVLMVRAWTWSAHDEQIHAQLPESLD